MIHERTAATWAFTTAFAALFSGCTTPAWADASSAAKGVLSAPVHLLGALAGCTVGTPIAIARYTGRDCREMVQEYKGDTPSWKLWGLMPGIPIAIFQGTMQGCFHGPKNALANCIDKPFDKEAFSLGDIP